MTPATPYSPTSLIPFAFASYHIFPPSTALGVISSAVGSAVGPAVGISVILTAGVALGETVGVSVISSSMISDADGIVGVKDGDSVRVTVAGDDVKGMFVKITIFDVVGSEVVGDDVVCRLVVGENVGKAVGECIGRLVVGANDGKAVGA